MKGRLLISVLLAAVLPASAGGIIPQKGSFVRPLTPRDSILVADRLLYGVELTEVPDSVTLAFPPIGNPLMEEVLSTPVWQIDTVRVRKVRATNRRLLDIRAQFAVQPFADGFFDLPPIAVQRTQPDGTVDTLLFEPQTIEVCTMPVDTATFIPHDLRGQAGYPVTASEVLPWLLLFWLAVLLVAGLVAWLHSRKRSAEGPAFREPAHITALRKLDKWRGDKFWAPERQKQFYSGVTDALREYIVARYGVGAMEMTTAEIFDGLRGTDIPADLYEEMKDLFERADFVKFAKYVATPEDNASVLPQAVRFVTSTYQAPAEENQDEKQR